MNDSQEFQRVAILFERVRDLTPDQREAVLQESTAKGDTHVVEQVRRLLVHHDTDNDAVHTDAAVPLLREAQREAEHGLPESIGGYRINSLIGRGGMGLVLLAEQASPQRRVALKIIRPGLLSDDLRRRFEFETEVLGQLQHPGIAQVYDAGVEDGDRPYFVMEYIDGQPLLQFAQQAKLGVTARLQLFAQICDAVLHAHQRGIIHRDLKPANILVTKDGQSKILDFGVARAVDSDLQATMATTAGQLVGTLPYMSPEQVQGRSLDIGTRSDVYALGVVLYELLVDELPIDLVDANLAAAARSICEDEPTPLTHHHRGFRGDLNTIALKALEKDPDRRYQSASDLAADVRRYLNHEAIQARPSTLIYQLAKFARRHKGLVAGLAATLTAMVAGIIGTTTQAVRATQQKQLAEQEANVATEVNQFIQRWLLSVDPTLNPGNAAEVTMQDALDRAVEKLNAEPPGHARVQASLEDTIGRAYIALGLMDKAASHCEKALDKTKEWYGGQSVEMANAIGQLAVARRLQGRYDESEELTFQALQRYQASPEQHQSAIASTYGRLVLTYIDAHKYDEALEYAQKAIEIRRDQRNGTGELEDLLDVDASQQLAAALMRAKRFEEAEALIVDVNDRLRELYGEHSHELAGGLNIEGLLYCDMGRLDEAIRCLRQVVEIQDLIYDDHHPDPAISRINLSIALQDRNEYDPDAEKYIREAVDMLLARLGPEHPHTLSSLAALGNLLNSTKRHEEARPILEDVFENRRRILGDEHPQTFSSLSNLVTYHRWMNEFDVAAELVQPFLELYEQLYGRDDPRVTWALYIYTRQLHDAGVIAKSNDEIEKSLPQYREVHDRFVETNHPRTKELEGHWLRALHQLGREEDAAALQREFQSATNGE